MKALILAGGYGTRLKELGENRAKPLLPVQGRPIIDYIVDRVENLPGMQEVLVVTNEKFYQDFCDWADAQKRSVDVRVINDKTQSPEDRLGSIGDIHFVVEKAPVQDDLLVVGGDNLFDYHLDQYIIFSRKLNGAATIGCFDIHSLEEARLFGVLELDRDGRLLSLDEKPDNPRSTLIGMCLYYFPQETLGHLNAYIKEVGRADRAGDYIRWLLQKIDVFGFPFEGDWYDIGSLDAYHKAQAHFGASSKRKDLK